MNGLKQLRFLSRERNFCFFFFIEGERLTEMLKTYAVCYVWTCSFTLNEVSLTLNEVPPSKALPTTPFVLSVYYFSLKKKEKENVWIYWCIISYILRKPRKMKKRLFSLFFPKDNLCAHIPWRIYSGRESSDRKRRGSRGRLLMLSSIHTLWMSLLRALFSWRGLVFEITKVEKKRRKLTNPPKRLDAPEKVIWLNMISAMSGNTPPRILRPIVQSGLYISFFEKKKKKRNQADLNFIKHCENLQKDDAAKAELA